MTPQYVTIANAGDSPVTQPLFAHFRQVGALLIRRGAEC
jgi:hypothetical protein